MGVFLKADCGGERAGTAVLLRSQFVGLAAKLPAAFLCGGCNVEQGPVGIENAGIYVVHISFISIY